MSKKKILAISAIIPFTRPYPKMAEIIATTNNGKDLRIITFF